MSDPRVIADTDTETVYEAPNEFGGVTRWSEPKDAPDLAPDPQPAPATDPATLPDTAPTVEQRDALARAFEKVLPGAKPGDIAVLVEELTAIMGEGGVG